VVGASKGIGRQIAIDLASNGYRGVSQFLATAGDHHLWCICSDSFTVVVSAKTTSDASICQPFSPDPNSPSSTINTVAREITETDGEATAIPVDVQSHESIQSPVDKTIETYGHIDTLVYNSGAIWWNSVQNTPVRRFQLMQRINPEGLYATVQTCLSHFEENGWKGRIVAVCPPIYSRFFRGKTAYAMGKVGMSVLVKGLAMDWEREGKGEMAITGIWPATVCLGFRKDRHGKV